MHGGHADRGRAHAVQERVEPRLGVFVSVLLPELEQERGAFAIGKIRQVFLAPWVTIILEQLGAAIGAGVSGVAHDIAHQPNERQVDRLAQGIAQGRQAPVVFLAKIIEGVQPAAGEKRFTGTGRIFAIQCSAEHLRQIVILVLDQVIDYPAAQPILLRHFDLFQFRHAHGAVLVVQLGDDLQVGGEHAHFRRRAQFEFAAFVDVERLVGAVGLHPYARTVRSQLEQGEAVAHLSGAGRRQQALSQQTDFCGVGRVGEFLQVGGGLGLQLALQGAGGRQVEAVEVVQGPIEHVRQTTAGRADAFIGFDGLNRWLGLPVAIADGAGQCSIGQRAVDHAALLEQPQMAVGEVGEFFTAPGQVIRRAALGDHQREHFAQGQAFVGHGFRVGLRAVELLVGLDEIGAVPDPQTFSHAVHFTVARYGGQRHAIEIIANDVLPCTQGLRTVLISTHAGGNHLPDLLGAGRRQALRRVPIFFQLCRQRTATRRLPGQVKHFRHLRPGSHAEPWPIHCRVGQRLFGVEQKAVFDKQQAADHYRRNRCKIRIQLLWIVVLVQRRRAAIGDRQPGLDLLGKRHKQAFVGVAEQGG